MDNLLKVGGHRINPLEIEDVLMSSGLCFESAVLGFPDPILGIKLVALISPLSRSLTENQIMKHCAGRLPKYKLPIGIKMVRVIPKNETGKIDREKCLELIASFGA